MWGSSWELNGPYGDGLRWSAPPPIVEPNRITGVGRAKGRGPDKAPRNELKRKRKATKIKKQSRRRNRRK